MGRASNPGLAEGGDPLAGDFGENEEHQHLNGHGLMKGLAWLGCKGVFSSRHFPQIPGVG